MAINVVRRALRAWWT